MPACIKSLIDSLFHYRLAANVSNIFYIVNSRVQNNYSIGLYPRHLIDYIINCVGGRLLWIHFVGFSMSS